MKLDYRVASIIAGAVVLAGGIAWWSGVSRDGAAASLADTTQVVQDDLLSQRSKGDADAPVTVLEASDFQCPWCRRFWEETLPIIEREYIATGKVRFVFLNFPVPSTHPNAPAAHELAMCAAQQDRFWPVHDLLYRHQAHWARLSDPAAFFRQLADSAGLASDSLESCFADGATRQMIQDEAMMAYRAGIQSTPSFVIEGALLGGAAPIDVWRPILDSIYQEKTRGKD